MVFHPIIVLILMKFLIIRLNLKLLNNSINIKFIKIKSLDPRIFRLDFPYKVYPNEILVKIKLIFY